MQIGFQSDGMSYFYPLNNRTEFHTYYTTNTTCPYTSTGFDEYFDVRC